MSRKPQPNTVQVIVGKAELEEFLQSGATDFAFEMECFWTIGEVMAAHIGRPNCRLQHNGTYVDPLKQINREFDVRLSFESYNRDCGFKLAVECKNITPEFPLLVYCVRRSTSETRFDQVVQHVGYQGKALRPISINSPYFAGKPVGKSCVQVGMEERIVSSNEVSRTFKSFDEGIYNKWSQALASLEAMLQDYLAEASDTETLVRWVPLRVLVVPDGRLWIVEFDERGIPKPLEQVDRIQYHVGKELTTLKAGVMVGHVEIVTLAGLRSLIAQLLDDLSDKSGWFKPPMD